MASSTLVPIAFHFVRSSPFHRLPIPQLKPFSGVHSALSVAPISSSILSATRVRSSDIDTTFFDTFNPDEDFVYDPPEVPEGFVAPPSFDEGPLESEDEIAAAYEELYGPAYSGVSVLGNDIYVMDSKMKKLGGFGSKIKKDKLRDGFEERVVQVRRVTKVVKGGKQLHFRAIVVVGDKKGQVGVGVGKAKEVISAVQKSAINARRNIVTVPMTKYLTFPHRSVTLSSNCKIPIPLNLILIEASVVALLSCFSLLIMGIRSIRNMGFKEE